jgi:hypothetical protein
MLKQFVNTLLDISGHWLVVDGLRFEYSTLESGQHGIRFTGKKGNVPREGAA